MTPEKEKGITFEVKEVESWFSEDLIKDEVYTNHARVTKTMSVREAVNDVRANRILLRPEFQREYIWTEAQATHLVDSILRNLGIPELWLWEHNKETPDGVLWEMLDGQQRLQALVYILGDVIKLDGFDGRFKSYNGFKFSELPRDIQETIKNYDLRFVCVKNHGDNIYAKRAYFFRLNKYPKPLRPQELRNCIFAGGFTESLKRLAERLNDYSVFERKRGNPVLYVAFLLALFDFPPEEHFHSKSQYLDQYMILKVSELEHDPDKLKIEIKTKRSLFDGLLILTQQVFGTDAFKLPVQLENGTVVYQSIARSHICQDIFTLMMWGFKPYLGQETRVIAKAQAIRKAFSDLIIAMHYYHRSPLADSKTRLLRFLEGWEVKLKEVLQNGGKIDEH